MAKTLYTSSNITDYENSNAFFPSVGLTFLFNHVSAQSNCIPPGVVSGVGCDEAIHSLTEEGPFYLRIYVHVIRDDNGQGPNVQTEESVREALAYLDESFNPHNIFFVWDCTIDWIDDTDLYQSTGQALWNNPQYNFHTDGIDIYLFPDRPPGDIGGGLAQNFGSTAFYTIGNQSIAPNQPAARSHVISHEMGHCLGLLHTHHSTSGFANPDTGPEYVDQSGLYMGQDGHCQNSGDCVCDTPADPQILSEVPHPGCQWTGYDEDENFDPYDPLTNNIMSYTNYACRENFTAGQGQRMRNYIATLEILQPCRLATTISQSTTWNLGNTPSGVVEIFDMLLIEPGASLTIGPGVTVRFAPESRVVIKPNARLILEGTLTSGACTSGCNMPSDCGNTWKGVEVWGDSEQHQFTTSYTNQERYQGRLTTRKGAVIENARVAVQLFGNNRSTSSGGIVSSRGTTFRNNTVSVQFAPCENYYPANWPTSNAGQPAKYRGNFDKCDFINNSDYPHENLFFAFVQMQRVEGPDFYGCSFVNSQLPSETEFITDLGYGIYSDDAQFVVREACNLVNAPHPCPDVRRSRFEGLGYGIFCGVYSSPVTRPSVIRMADFRDCYIGIENRRTNFGTIVFNDFYLGNVPTTSVSTNQTGIYLRDPITMIDIQENQFIGDPVINPALTTHGISAFNVGTTNKSIRRNFFSNIDIANEAGGISGNDMFGIFYECNVNQDNREWDFLVCDYPLFANNRIRGVQVGDIIVNGGAESAATGNQFSNSASNADRDFANTGGSNLDYYYYEDAGVLETPDEFSGLTNIFDEKENTCVAQYCRPPCTSPTPFFSLTELKEDFENAQRIYQSSLEEYLQARQANQKSLAKIKQVETVVQRQHMDHLGHQIIYHMTIDSNLWHQDSLYHWIYSMQYPELDMDLAFQYLQDGEEQKAREIWDLIATRYTLPPRQAEDVAAAKKLFEIRRRTDGDRWLVEDKEFIELQAESQNIYSASLSHGLLGNRHQKRQTTDCISFDVRSEMSSEIESLSPRIAAAVYPNPNHGDVVYLEMQRSERLPKYVYLYSMDGKLHSKIQWVEENTVIEISTAELTSGMYFLTLEMDDNFTITQRFMIDK